jgi:hypothetical protein
VARLEALAALYGGGANLGTKPLLFLAGQRNGASIWLASVRGVEHGRAGKNGLVNLPTLRLARLATRVAPALLGEMRPVGTAILADPSVVGSMAEFVATVAKRCGALREEVTVAIAH